MKKNLNKWVILFILIGIFVGLPLVAYGQNNEENINCEYCAGENGNHNSECRTNDGSNSECRYSGNANHECNDECFKRGRGRGCCSRD